MPLTMLAAYGAGIQIHVEDLAAHLAGRERCDAEARWEELILPIKGSRLTEPDQTQAAELRSAARVARDTPRALARSESSHADHPLSATAPGNIDENPRSGARPRLPLTP